MVTEGDHAAGEVWFFIASCAAWDCHPDTGVTLAAAAAGPGSVAV